MLISPNQPTKAQELFRSIHKLQKRSLVLNRHLKRHKAAKKFFKKTSLISDALRQRSKSLLASAGLAGALLLNPLNPSASISRPLTKQISLAKDNELTGSLARSLKDITPHSPTSLGSDQAQQISNIIKSQTGIMAKAVLGNNQLNHQVGFVGYEQHLKRFPGDNLFDHDDEQIAGMAPGLGAFGYFAPDRAHFTTTDYLNEKYYLVAQLHLLPAWNAEYYHLKDWYKFRKMIMINPVNGRAVVGVLGDAGPADWTSKHFGASPEAMKALNLHKGSRKGLVLLLFVDDPDNLVPLGPVTYKLDQLP